MQKTWDCAPDGSTIPSRYQRSSRTSGADIQTSSQEVFFASKVNTSRVSYAVLENANFLWTMSRQIRTRINTSLPSPAHFTQGKQSKESSQSIPDSEGVAKVTRQYKVGDPEYALYYGPHHDKHSRRVPAVVKKSMGTHCFNVKIIPHGPVWRRHWEQLRPRYASDKDNEPGDAAEVSELPIKHPMEIPESVPHTESQNGSCLPTFKIPVPEYGPGNPRTPKQEHPNQNTNCVDDCIFVATDFVAFCVLVMLQQFLVGRCCADCLH